MREVFLNLIMWKKLLEGIFPKVYIFSDHALITKNSNFEFLKLC